MLVLPDDNLRRRLAAFLLLVFQITALAGNGKPELPRKEIINSITAQELKMHLDCLASDAQRGKTKHISTRPMMIS